MNLLGSAEADEPKESQPPQDADDSEDEKLLLFEAFADTVRAGITMQPEKHGKEAEFVAYCAMQAGCTTLPELHDWMARQHSFAKRSGFKPPNARHFPEPEIVTLVKYLRYAEQARANPFH